MNVSAATASNAAEWDAYVLAHPDGTGNHLWGWQEVYARAFGHKTLALVARDGDGTLVGLLMVVVFNHRLAGRFLVSLPFVNYGGVLASSDAAAAALLEAATDHARSIGASHVELRHVARRYPDLPAKAHKVSMKAPLAPSVDAAWDALDRKVRNQVRKAEKAGVAVVVGGSALVDDFYAVFARNMRDLGTPVYPREWFAALFDVFPDRSRVLVAQLDGRPIAGAITFRHLHSVEIPSASSLREFRSTSANMLLYWHIMQQAIRDGVLELDYGRSTPGESTYQFKSQWGAVPGPMYWEYRLVGAPSMPERSPSNPRFELAIAAWKRLPLGVANLLGPRIVRYLP